MHYFTVVEAALYFVCDCFSSNPVYTNLNHCFQNVYNTVRLFLHYCWYVSP